MLLRKSGLLKKKQHSCIKLRMLSGLLILIFCCFIPGVSYAVKIKSRSAVVMDADTGRVLYAKNPKQKLKPASTAKLMTALIVLESTNMNDIVTISKRAASTAPTRAGFKVGDRVSVKTLLYAALMKSANDASVALAEKVSGSVKKFVKLMNRKAAELGIRDTRFVNPNGLPGRGQYITAYDLAIMMRQAIKHPVLREIIGTRVARVSIRKGKTILIRNTNKLLWTDDDLLGGKTGYTRRARHNFVSAAERDSGTVIVALLGAPKRALLWKETEDLIDFGYKVIDHIEKPVLYWKNAKNRGSKAIKTSHVRKSMYKQLVHKKLKKTKKGPVYR
jgi:D-alanyl-D-alanine carboxypeptidase (penicillin-binding protein 5/6)